MDACSNNYDDLVFIFPVQTNYIDLIDHYAYPTHTEFLQILEETLSP